MAVNQGDGGTGRTAAQRAGSASASRRVLFLCSGNYYRSRFAEMLFNARAAERGLSWRADSRGLAIDLYGWRNPGPLSPFAVEGLRNRGIAVPQPPREPVQAAESDFADSALVIALKEVEHRPLVEVLFPGSAERVEYWHIHDVDCCKPEAALPELERLVLDLLDRLAAAPS